MMDSSPEEEAPVRITREAPKRGGLCRAFPLGFSRDWEIYRDEAKKATAGTKKGRHAHAYRPSSQ